MHALCSGDVMSSGTRELTSGRAVTMRHGA